MSRFTPSYWTEAQRALCRRDPVLAKVIRAYKGESLTSHGNPHYTLSRSIVGQQISVKAADAVWFRFEETLKDVTPQRVLELSQEELRACGLSQRKAEYLHHLSERFARDLQHYDWEGASDEDITQVLIAIKGIGRWTAEMFLIFHLMRPDVFPIGDIGVQKGIQKLYNQGEKMSLPAMAEIGESWRPWRTVGSWYMWRLLDPVTVAY